MSMIIMNGSPKAERGNTEVFIRKFMEGMQAAEGTTECASAQVCYVAKESHEEIAAKMQEYDTIIIAFPLYVHAMPGTVKKVLEYMKPVEGSGKKLGFIIQYGFMEGAQSQYVVRYLESFTKKMNYESVGIAVHGGSAGVSIMPDKMNRKLFDLLLLLGKSFSETGHFSADAVAALCQPYELTKRQCRMYNFIGGVDMYWNMQLKQNNAMKQRFDRPFA